MLQIPSLYCNKKTASRNGICLSQYRYHIATLMRFVAIASHFFATICATNATSRWHCNILVSITTKCLPSCNGIFSSQYHYHIAMPTQFVAIWGLYCNKFSIYRDQTKLWQYVRPITTTGEFVVILCFIATKLSCSNNFCCNRPKSL